MNLAISVFSEGGQELARVIFQGPYFKRMRRVECDLHVACDCKTFTQRKPPQQEEKCDSASMHGDFSGRWKFIYLLTYMRVLVFMVVRGAC